MSGRHAGRESGHSSSSSVWPGSLGSFTRRVRPVSRHSIHKRAPFTFEQGVLQSNSNNGGPFPFSLLLLFLPICYWKTELVLSISFSSFDIPLQHDFPFNDKTEVSISAWRIRCCGCWLFWWSGIAILSLTEFPGCLILTWTCSASLVSTQLQRLL